MGELSRAENFKLLLIPIAWSWESSLETRRSHVLKRRLEVKLVYPFLTGEEKKLADTWLATEGHDDLWD